MAKHKSFIKDNPALRFISTAKPADNIPEPEQGQSVPMKLNPLYIETKSRRLQLLFQPSLYNKLKAIAQSRGISLNDLIQTTLEEYAKTEEH